MQALHWCYVSASLVGKDVPFGVATKIRSSYIVMYDIWKEDEIPNLLEPTANPWSDRRSNERQCGLIRMAV
ncbi:hypothetical protein D6D29_09053 [Aureobasidium pullulans]|uniref:Uncharacterized protein n=1 Tax=Aureobasidium pullulans TaxID=5580 RepID=A0A4S9ZUR7_AURPU|nr:hypothetical protein D6D29_09053 [Aureobasidium pullulans]THX64174.1 hypothetical protein D6D08_08045 [Aureobasidium pullulans]TIA08825.1 hypothetical protein D6C83_08588 [Aureobasidium pullulans]TIA65895.1 hypothetical protein D6C76_09339 [Aureobasidium pullulans]